MTNENHPKVRDLLDNYDNYMQQLIAMPDKVLEKKVNLARIQMQMALEQKKFVEVDVLYLFWTMIVEARVKRMEMGIEDEEEPKGERTKKAQKKKKRNVPDVAADFAANEEFAQEEYDSGPEKPEQLSLFQD